MTERIKPELDWHTVQGTLRFAGTLAIFSENMTMRVKDDVSTFLSTLLESASIITGPAAAAPHDKPSLPD